MTINKQQFAKQLGLNIAQKRIEQQLTQEQLAERLGLSNEAISRIERGVAMPSLMRLVELANEFKCSMADLFSQTTATDKDQANRLEQLLQMSHPKDRQFLLDFIEQFIQHSKEKESSR